MPELPDLQAFSGNLNKKLHGKVLKKINVVNTGKLKVPKKELKDALEKQAIKKVYREGKELRFAFKGGHILGMHLMLRGQLFLLKGTNDKKSTIVELLFDDETLLVLVDFQGMAAVSLNPAPWDAPDALSDEINEAFLKERLQKKSNVKKLLLDQHVIRGIGNAYADEILWEAGIAPSSIGNKIPEAKIKALAKSIKSVLKDGEKQIIKTHPDIISGEVRDFLKIHNSKKTHSPNGALIHNEMLNSRITYWTDEQELFE